MWLLHPQREARVARALASAALLCFTFAMVACSTPSPPEAPDEPRGAVNEAHRSADATQRAAMEARRVAANAASHRPTDHRPLELRQRFGGPLPVGQRAVQAGDRLVVVHFLEHDAVAPQPVMVTVWDAHTRRLEHRIHPRDGDDRPVWSGIHREVELTADEDHPNRVALGVGDDRFILDVGEGRVSERLPGEGPGKMSTSKIRSGRDNSFHLAGSIEHPTTGETVELDLCGRQPSVDHLECLPAREDSHLDCGQTGLCEELRANQVIAVDGSDALFFVGSFPTDVFKYDAPQGVVGWIDGESGELLDLEIGVLDAPTRLIFSPDGEELVSGSYNRIYGVRFWSVRDGDFERALPRGNVADMTFSQDGSDLYVLGDWYRRTDQPAVFNVTRATYPKLEVKGTYSLHRLLGGAPESTDPPLQVRRLTTDSTDEPPAASDELPLLSVETEGGDAFSLGAQTGHNDGKTGVATCARDKLVAAIREDGGADIWDGSTGDQRTHLKVDGRKVTNLAFNPQTCALALSTRDPAAREDERDHGIQVWNPSDEELIAAFPAPDERVTSLTWLPDHRGLAVGRHDGAVSLLSLEHQTVVATPQEHDAPVSAMALDPKGELFAAGDRGGFLTTWSLIDPTAFDALAAESPAIDSYWARTGTEPTNRLETCKIEGVYSTLGPLPHVYGPSQEAFADLAQLLDSRLLERTLELHDSDADRRTKRAGPNLFVLDIRQAGGHREQRASEITIYATHHERLEPTSPSGWQIETPCDMTLVVPATPSRSDKDEVVIELRGDLRARFEDGPWREFDAEVVYDRKEERLELRGDDETLIWE